MNDETFILEWNSDQLGDNSETAGLVKFPGWDETMGFIPERLENIPKDIYFEADFAALQKIDYPYNDALWPIMSKKMRTIIENESHNINSIDVIMVDDTISDTIKKLPDATYKSEFCNYEFKAIIPKIIDVIDFTRSKLTTHPKAPQVIMKVEELHLMKSISLPPFFRAQGLLTTNFVSREVKEKIEQAGLFGMKFIPLSQFKK